MASNRLYSEGVFGKDGDLQFHVLISKTTVFCGFIRRITPDHTLLIFSSLVYLYICTCCYKNPLISLYNNILMPSGTHGVLYTAPLFPSLPSLQLAGILQQGEYSGSSHKLTPSGHGKGVRNWSWPLTRMVLLSGHWRCKG